MPERHIKHTHAKLEGSSWCGQVVTQFDWCFLHIDHATCNQLHGSVAVCPKCIRAIVAALTGKAADYRD